MDSNTQDRTARSGSARDPKSPGYYISTDYRVIHDDADILVVDKPAPLAVYAVGAYKDVNLHALLRSDERWAASDLRFAHRLDAETSGVIVIAKSPEAARALGLQFLGGKVRKIYRALTFGTPEPGEGRIELPLGTDDSSGFQTVRILDHQKGETAVTLYRVLERRGDYAWVRLEPLTGRTHQLRAHLALIGHPIVGDKIYVDVELFRRYVIGGLDEEILRRLKLPRLALHAERIEFTHPRTHDPVGYQSDVPDFLGGIAA
ncbi:MAG: Ribosomal large subunit pseudouridine synthase A [Candidatus Omnitrophica bacterium]|nr:Ribosomal large subunit pseudouridine synthase A [Candidatus Omnitrophota bacterium]